MLTHIDTARILVVDEDWTLRHTVVSYFKEHSLTADAASLQQVMMGRPAIKDSSLVILAQRLGQQRGFDLLREIQSRNGIPVIITADRECSETDRVMGLELGADDYLVEPFGLRELLARVRAVLRRRGIKPIAFEQGSMSDVLAFEGWTLNRCSRHLTNPDGALVALTRGEYSLLIAFLNAPLRTLTREHLLRATRVEADAFDRSIDVQVLRLRRKLETHRRTLRFIETERGVGYRFALRVDKLNQNHLDNYNGSGSELTRGFGRIFYHKLNSPNAPNRYSASDQQRTCCSPDAAVYAPTSEADSVNKLASSALNSASCITNRT